MNRIEAGREYCLTDGQYQKALAYLRLLQSQNKGNNLLSAVMEHENIGEGSTDFHLGESDSWGRIIFTRKMMVQGLNKTTEEEMLKVIGDLNDR